MNYSPISTRPTMEAPPGWKWRSLTDVARLESGHTPSRRVSAYWDSGDVPWLSLKDIRNLSSKYVFDTADKPTALGIQHSSARILPRGTVALCRTASVGKAAVLGVDMATSQDFVNWVCGDEIWPEYLYWAFQSSQATFELEKQGSTHQTMYMPTVERFRILLPPIAEQRRIAEILDKADALRTKRRAALAQLDTLTQSIFLDMFGDPAKNEKVWPMRPLESVAVKFSDGPFGSNLKTDHYRDSGVRVIRLQNVGVGRLLDENHAFVSPAHFEKLRKHECAPGDVIIATMGDPNLRACVLPPSIRTALNKADCIQMRVDKLQTDSDYICTLINHPSTLKLAQVLMHGQTRVRISMGQLRQLRVPVPPIELQIAFARRVSAVRRLRDAQESSYSESERLFASLQHRAFRGEL